MQVFGESI